MHHTLVNLFKLKHGAFPVFLWVGTNAYTNTVIIRFVLVLGVNIATVTLQTEWRKDG